MNNGKVVFIHMFRLISVAPTIKLLKPEPWQASGNKRKARRIK